MLQAMFILIGLSLDAFIVMMQKGATIKQMRLTNSLIYSLEFSLVSTCALLCGYLIGNIPAGILPDGRTQIGAACLIIILIGNYELIKSFTKNEFVEKLDRDFGSKKILRLALITSLDILITGVGFALLNYPVWTSALLCLAVSFISIFIALNIGYHLGAGYQKIIGVVGGILMILFGILIFIRILQV